MMNHVTQTRLGEGIGSKGGKTPAETTVVVAMSGGVDSSVAAALLVQLGYNCVGVMMRLWAETGAGQGSTNKCCSLESVNDARAVAHALGMPFYLINVEEPFKRQVVDDYISRSAQGLTPNPCMECNRHIRFDYLLNYARKLGADFLATGHYARLRRVATGTPGATSSGTVQLLRAVDVQKDQSYVLSVMGQDELNDVLFPLGSMTKSEVRALAQAHGLPVASKHDSMDLCFIFDDDHRRFLRDWGAEAMRPGPIVDRSGHVWGQHAGLPGYTIGQRKGLGVGGRDLPLYVVDMDPAQNALIVGSLEELSRTTFRCTGVTWTAGSMPSNRRALVKIRYKAEAVPCTLGAFQPDGTLDVRLDAAARGISPGQSAVFHDPTGEVVLGGGVIAR
jgi:tRNA-specific 2-thiouridylase